MYLILSIVGVQSWLPIAAADSDVKFLHGMLEGMASIEARAYGLLRELGADPLTKVTGRFSVFSCTFVIPEQSCHAKIIFLLLLFFLLTFLVPGV